MATALGTATPSAFKVGTADCTAIYLGGTLAWPTTTPPTVTTYSYDFTGANGSAAPTAFSIAKGMYGGAAYPTRASTIQNNKLVLSTGTAAAWSGAASIFLGDPAKPEGNAATGAPPIASNGTWTFDYTLLNLSEQYPMILLRGRGADLWPSGGGANQFATGTYLQLGVAGGAVDIITGYNTTKVGGFNYSFTSVDQKAEITLDRKMLYVRLWPANGTKPTGYTYSGAVMADESDGNIGFALSNGPAAEQKTLTIDNLVYTAPVLTLGSTVAAPTSEPAGFTRIYTENFNDTAPAGTGTSSFLNVYSTRVQPYDEVSPKYQQRALLSAHDGVMDVAMNGTQGAAWAYGSASTANGFIGGRFSFRAKTIGAYNNGPAWMIWPSNNAWVEGEIDFPESVSGPGGTQGFQDAPFIHHHTMNTDHPNDQAAAQDVNLLVSWRDWHVYTAEWYPPGKAPTPYAASQGLVIYYVDNVEVYRTTTDIPKTYHRFMAQVGEYGTAGNMYIDYVTMATKD
jgi:hypothetical protein